VASAVEAPPAARERRPPSLARFVPDDERRRLLILLGVLLVVCVALPFASSFGRFAADTRSAVYFSPREYLHNALFVWQPNPYLGNEQHDGLLFPMGIVVPVLRMIGLAPWAAERVWHGLLLFTAASGMIVLLKVLRPGRVSAGHVVAAAAFAFNPFSLGAAMHGTGAYLAYFVLPWLVAAFAWGLRRPRSWIGPALVALASLAMGGGNGASQVYAVVPLLGYLLWVVFVTREVRAVDGLLFALKAAVFAVAVNLWWLVGLTSTQVANDIAFSEQPTTINVASSFSESLRLVGFWGYYGGDRFGPWYPTISSLFTSPPLVLASFALPVGAFVLAFLSRWRYRLLFVLFAILAIVVMAGIFPVDHPTPFGRALLTAYDQVPGAVGLRTTYKLGGLLALSIAVLLGVGIEELRIRRSPGTSRVVTGVAAVLVMAGSVPLWTGQLYPEFRTSAPVPDYWNKAVAQLDRSPEGQRAWFVPGSLQVFYRWGGLVGGIPELHPDLAAVRRPGVAIGERYVNNLLAAMEQPFQAGPNDPGATAPLMRYLGARYAVLQNDLDWERSLTARPLELQTLLDQKDLRLVAGYGNPGENIIGPGGAHAPDVRQRLQELGLTPVQVLEVANPAPDVSASAAAPLVVAGDAFALPALGAAGDLDGLPPILYTGNLTARQLDQALEAGGTLVISDSNRRRVWRIGAMRSNFSYTLPADENLGSSRTGFNLFGSDSDSQTVARYPGVAAVRASAYGSEFADQPAYRPINAVDGDTNTAWLVGGFTNPVGQFLRVDFQHPTRLSSIDLTPHQPGPGKRTVRSVRLVFSDGTEFPADVPDQPTHVEFPARTARWVEVEISGVANRFEPSPVGFDEVSIPGVESKELLRLPQDVWNLAASSPAARIAIQRSPLVYEFTRARSDSLGPDEERGVRRIFDVPGERAFALGGRVHVDPAISDEAVDQMVYGPGQEVTAVASERARGIGSRGSAAIDGDELTAWQAMPGDEPSLEIEFPFHEIGKIRIVPVKDQRHALLTHVRLDFRDGSHVADVPLKDGEPTTFKFRPRSTSGVRITVTGAFATEPLPIGIAQVQIPDVEHLRPPDEETPLPCTAEAVTVDGRAVRVQAKGTVGELLGGESMPLRSCDGKGMVLPRGPHAFEMVGTLQPDSVFLRSAGTREVAPRETPKIEVTRTSPTAIDVRVTGAGPPFLLSLGENWSPGWTARIGDRTLGEPLVVNGYSAGWRIFRPGSFVVHIRYAGQARTSAALVVSVAATVVVAAIVAIGLVRARRRRRPA
jgi:arabinofuranan 3-O-arabinosyltransferase